MLLDITLLLVGASAVGFGMLRVSKDYLDPLGLFTMFFALKYLIRPFILIFGYDVPAAVIPESSDEVSTLAREAVILFIIAYISFVWGYGRRSIISRYITSLLPKFEKSPLRMQRLEAAVLACIAISWMAITSYIFRYTSISEFMVEARGDAFGVVIKQLPILTSFIAALFLVFCLKYKGRRLPRALVYFALTLILLFLINDRSSAVFAVVAVAMGYHFSVHRLSAKQVSAALCVGLFLLAAMTLARIVAHNQKGESMEAVVQNLDMVRHSSPMGYITMAFNLMTVDYFLIVLRDYEAQDLHFGGDYVRGAVGIVPRSLWPSKPENITVGSWFKDKYFSYDAVGGRPITGVGEWYLNFGVPGVVFSCLIAGIFYRALFERMRASRFDPRIVLLYVVLFFGVTGLGLVSNVIFQNVILWILPVSALFRWIRK